MKKLFKNIIYLLEYFFVLIVLKILGALGIDKSVNICRYLARKIGPLLPVNKVAKENIQNILGNNLYTNEGSINSQAIVNQVWDNFGSFIGEFPYVNKMSEEELSRRIEISGLENIIEFQKSQQPFLFFTGHFANWDFALKISNKFYHKFAIIYRKLNNPYVDKLINDTRISNDIKLIPKGTQGVRELISAIKSGYAIGMLVDQKMNNGIEVPFLGQPAMTAQAIAKIALQFSYPIIPLQVVRTNSNNSYFKIIIHPPIKLQKTNNNQTDCYNIMVTINQILGNWVKENPGQWFWFHNRWKKNHNKYSKNAYSKIK
ncbi:LpxL/LpxP family acyltransferase [Rickettsia endosymbiont of Culicoides newsteadi]|uniref:LpxL/LpxP family acyltransferase n=1 Tax=Rickettsia endosymbiont of Culicoides newsteadi TaxID=1961830 RepID=UPI000B9BDF04|nr:lipid A biosynthesis lauroyl acyltransferase [Rickettsia endosymbiont of Culicoides newsteadi]OZG32336.1 lauroyl acyltransferase [Rickettsia endosymbiont of Culicoides newsteadi]